MVHTTNFVNDAPNRKMLVTRTFSAPMEHVWQAWTDSKILDQWWAPKPWKVNTKTMDFREGGYWLYSMNGPAGEQSWSKCDFKNIVTHASYESHNIFCDENGVINTDFPIMDWKNTFRSTADGTEVTIDITFSSEESMVKLVAMGFAGGFTMAHGNLDELLAN